jgi:hypothetical protein
VAVSATLLAREQCVPQRLVAYRGFRPSWSAALPPGYALPPSRVPPPTGTSVIAVATSSSAHSGSAVDWLFYRLSDGSRLWTARAPQRLLLAGNRVIGSTSASGLTVRDAFTGRVLWHRDARTLHLADGGLDRKAVASRERVHALWDTVGLRRTSLLTFDAATGRPSPTAPDSIRPGQVSASQSPQHDRPAVTGASTRARTAPLPGLVRAFWLRSRDRSGGGLHPRIDPLNGTVG